MTGQTLFGWRLSNLIAFLSGILFILLLSALLIWGSPTGFALGFPALATGLWVSCAAARRIAERDTPHRFTLLLLDRIQHEIACAAWLVREDRAADAAGHLRAAQIELSAFLRHMSQQARRDA